MSLTDFKSKAAEWFMGLKPETALLVALSTAIFFAIWNGVPYILTETKGHIEAINSAHGQNIERISTSFDRATEAFNKQAERDRQLLEQVIQQRHGVTGAAVGRNP